MNGTGIGSRTNLTRTLTHDSKKPIARAGTRLIYSPSQNEGTVPQIAGPDQNLVLIGMMALTARKTQPTVGAATCRGTSAKALSPPLEQSSCRARVDAGKTAVRTAASRPTRMKNMSGPAAMHCALIRLFQLLDIHSLSLSYTCLHRVHQVAKTMRSAGRKCAAFCPVWTA